MKVNLAGDFPELRPQFVKVDPKRIRNFGVSPSGVRAVMEAWGEISRCRRRKATSAISRTARRPPSAIRRGRPTASGSPTSPTPRANMGSQIRDQTGLARRRRSRSAASRSITRPVWSPD